MSPREKLLVSLLVLLGVLVVGSVGFQLLDGATFWQSVYFTAVTLSTVGYECPEWVGDAGKIWSVLIIFFGIAAVTIAFSSLQAMVVGGTVRQIMGRRKLESKISHVSDHIVICGYGRMGRAVVKDLRLQGKEVVVIDRWSERTAQLDEEGILYVLDDATEEESLVKAGIDRAKGLVTLLSNDADNVYVTLTARGLRGDLMIVSRAESQSTEPKLRRAGANRVITPQTIGAQRIVNVLTRPHVVDFVELAAKGLEIEMDEYSITERSPFCGETLRTSQLRRQTQAMVVAIRHADGKTTYAPDPDVALNSGDTLVLLGPSDLHTRLDALDRTT